MPLQLEAMKMDPTFLNRNVNEGFSGGEKKRNEILQLAVLEPEVAILDEIDSGLDVDALRDVSDAVNGLRCATNIRLGCSRPASILCNISTRRCSGLRPPAHGCSKRQHNSTSPSVSIIHYSQMLTRRQDTFTPVSHLTH